MPYKEIEDPSLPEWPEWQCPRTAAKYLDSTPDTLADWRFKGKGPTFKRVGKRMVRYRKADLDDWMEAQA
ncbi:AlpA family transcriptional regulator [Paracoccus sp. SCSIO 75233]|uniref:helix-turn-helix transcriptional regulator n=1 Tax=Paracoccus sp. SCSIO 75233 TaxID=3017782 RepID=UPI0022F08E34|nr:helix-turn-helix domain-containing protein [Paracoccus sp. SCSIO 75233]WBU54162.1 helix-turn-helix domain-containing protein [Paracoccus sp. SCSIO 75233]